MISVRLLWDSYLPIDAILMQSTWTHLTKTSHNIALHLLKAYIFVSIIATIVSDTTLFMIRLAIDVENDATVSVIFSHNKEMPRRRGLLNRAHYICLPPLWNACEIVSFHIKSIRNANEMEASAALHLWSSLRITV